MRLNGLRRLKRFGILLGATGFSVILASGTLPLPGICGTCWDNENAHCIIDQVLVEDACDAATPGCYPQET